MRTISATIDIDAEPGAVWAVLTDLRRYRDWNPFIREAVGEIAVGARLKLRTVPQRGRARTLRPRLRAAEPGISLRWLGRLLVPWLLDGEHEFTLSSPDSHSTRVVQSERFTGLLVPLAGALIAATEDDFRALNEALKRRVEGGNRRALV